MPVKHVTELQQRSKPTQKRSELRNDVILKTTAALLQQVGLDHLTTTMIAQECGISVGAFYHYFPNKHAILYAIAKRWLDDALSVLIDWQTRDIKNATLESFVSFIMDAELIKYREQKGLMPLIEAMHTIPELRSLSQEHDKLVLTHYPTVFRKLGIKGTPKELRRIAACFYEFSYPLLLLASQQTEPKQTQALMDDLKFLSVTYLKRYL
jgi:AcrR family transcriptional regulator